MKLIRTIFALLICTSSSFSMADPSGPLGLDHRLDRDTSGIWADSNQKAVEYGSALLLLGGAFYEGNTTRIGKTLWQSVDAMLLGDVSAAAGKAVFRRQRPIDGNDPNAFFKSGTDNSFPSGEMTHITAIVTPLILEYQQDAPQVWLLALLPAYVGVARLKAQAHWQTDILASVALGAGVGYFAHQHHDSWSASVLPGGLSVGYRKKF